MPDSAPSPRGVLAAALTPLTADLEPDLPRFVEHCRWLLGAGCDGLAPLGTTGEANSLSVEQRLAVIAALAEAGLAERAVVGTGSCALADAIRLSRDAITAGAAGVLTLPPFYYKDPTEDGLYAFFAALIEGVGDGRLRLYLYHFPRMSSVPIPATLIARLIEAFPGTVAGVKDSSGDQAHTEMLIREFPDLDIFAGSERFLLETLRAGGAGCISASVNVTAPLAAEVARRAPGAEADPLQAELTQLRLALEDFPMIAALKALKADFTGEAAWRHILPPLRGLDAAGSERLRAALEDLAGFERLRAA